MKKKLIFAIIILIIAIGAVSAADSNATAHASYDDIIVDSCDTDFDNDILELDRNQEYAPLAGKNSNAGTFTELQNKINSAKKGSTITLTKDYHYNNDFSSKNGIKITKPITIDGKGHAIDGLDKSPLLLVLNTKNVVLKNIVFKNGFVEDVGDIGVFYSNNVKFINCKIINNYVYDDGAVFLAYSNYSSFVACEFKNNFADYGGAVYLDHSTASFETCNFNENWVSYNGGAIYMDYSSSSFDSCNFDDNCADYSGGAIYMDYSSSSFDSCNFDDNCAVYSGGAIWSFQSALNFLNTKFNGNYADIAGGDLYSQYSMIYLQDSSFNESNSYGFGGSLSFYNDYVQIRNCSFEECESDTDAGGAVYSLNSILNCFDSEFKECRAYYGGAICSLNTELNIKNNNFDTNMAPYVGGSIYALYGSITVDSSNFTYSRAPRGGAMYIRSPHRINNITNNRFLYCFANLGQRIYVDSYYGEIPESGNIYEDIYFVYGNITSDLNGKKHSNYSNTLTYVISSTDEFQNNLSFYNSLRDDFTSGLNLTNNNTNFNIFDENAANNSTIFLNYGKDNNLRVIYDAGQINSSTSLKLNFCILNGGTLANLDVFPYIGNVNGSDETHHIIYFKEDSNRLSLYPVFDYEKNITVLDKNGDDAYIWARSLSLDESYSYNANGKFNLNFEDEKLYLDRGNIYEFSYTYCPTPIFNYNYTLTEILPSDYDYYDGRYRWDDEGNFIEEEDYAYVTPVKDQGIGSNCWVFAGIATLEACLKKITGKTFDLSENNAKNVMASSSLYGLNLETNTGGYDSMFISYLASWLGPNFEKNDEYNPLSSLSMELKPGFRIQDISFLHPRKDAKDNDEFKYAIANYGAVAVTVNWTVKNSYKGMHAVCLIGWDDDYEGTDSLGNYANGAWIFKNSWSEFWGEDGFGYLSYEQKLSGEIAPYMHAYTFVFNDDDLGYQQCYNYDFAGVTDYLCTDDDYIYYKNKFTARDDEYLLAFSTYFEKETNFTFSVHINGKAIPKDNIKIFNSPAGYHIIPLGYNVTLKKGDEFEIVIKLLNDERNYIPVCQADELYKLSYPNNVSFISYDGEDWFDLYDLNSNTTFAYGGIKTDTCQVACIKAFTALRNGVIYGPYNDLIKSINKTYGSYHLNASLLSNKDGTFTLRIDITDWNYNLEIYDNYIELRIDNYDTYYLKVKNGTANFKMDLPENECYNCHAKLKSNYYSSGPVEFVYGAGDFYLGTFTELKETIENASEESTIYLDKNYYCDGNFTNEAYILINKSLTIDGRGHVLHGCFKSGIFKISPNWNVTLININFKYGNSNYGGAIYSNGNLNISNCNFDKNYAEIAGGAIYSEGECNIKNTAFNSNHGQSGSAIYSIYMLNVTDSEFKSQANPDLDEERYNDDTAEVIYFRYSNGKDNESPGNLYLKNNKITSKGAAIYYDEDKIPYELPLQLIFTNAHIIKGNNVMLCQIKDSDGTTFRMNDINVKITNKNAKSKIVTLKLEYDDAHGAYIFDTSSLNYGTYKLSGSLSKDYARDCTVKDGILYIVKKSVLKTSSLTKVYGSSKKLTVTLRDINRKAIKNAYLTVKLNGKTSKIKTNSKGQASLSIRLAPKTYTATITYAGNDKYSSATTTAKIKIKKATPKITAKRKTFKLKTKTKKYTITLKNNLGKAMKKTRVTLKIKGKTYKATTNKKGKATFKIKNLKKRGSYRATVKYTGSKYYNAISKKTIIRVIK